MIVELLLLAQIASTLAMVGLIWFVQVVHYPLFSAVGRRNFGHYERSHQRRTTIVVAPLMLAEALTATTMIWCRPDGISQSMALFGVALVAILWISTFFWQVPLSAYSRRICSLAVRGPASGFSETKLARFPILF